jgi:Rho-binding antiterminator
MSSDNYKPIDCGLHSEYELAIMHGRTLKLKWLDENGNVLTEKLKPLDIETRDQQEFLIASNTNDILYKIRLDRIIRSDLNE